MIKGHLEHEKRLNAEIPEEKTISIFTVHTKVIRDNLAAKYNKIAMDMIKMVAVQAKQQSIALLKEFDVFNEKVNRIPDGIENLSETKDFMAALPAELEKKQADIKKVTQTYDILDMFHHRFEEEEDSDRIFLVYGAPKDTMEQVEKQQGFLEKEKEKFIKIMDNNK
jgi:hypothetical protein